VFEIDRVVTDIDLDPVDLAAELGAARTITMMSDFPMNSSGATNPGRAEIWIGAKRSTRIEFD